MKVRLWKTFVVKVPPHVLNPMDFLEGYIYERGIDLIGRYVEREDRVYELEALDIIEDEE